MYDTSHGVPNSLDRRYRSPARAVELHSLIDEVENAGRPEGLSRVLLTGAFVLSVVSFTALFSNNDYDGVAAVPSRSVAVAAEPFNFSSMAEVPSKLKSLNSVIAKAAKFGKSQPAEQPKPKQSEPTPNDYQPVAVKKEGYVETGNGFYLPPILLKIRFCESSGDYKAANGHSSARGAYQFLTSSWADYGHAERYGVPQAHFATPAQQDEAAYITWQRSGTKPWNASKHCWGNQ